MDNLTEAFTEIFQGRSDYQLKQFVVDAHLTPERQYAQVVLELQNKHFALRRADVQRRRILEQLRTATGLDAEELAIDLELVEIGIVGAQREYNALFAMWQQMPKYTNEQLQAAEEGYWRHRLLMQAANDMLATGTVSTGNLDALRQAKINVRTIHDMMAKLSDQARTGQEQITDSMEQMIARVADGQSTCVITEAPKVAE